MNCEDVERDEIAEQYVSGRLDDAERDAYEVHFFECVGCLDHLQLLQSIQTNAARRPDLVVIPQRRPPSYSLFRWLPAAAMLVLLAGIAWWNLRRVSPPHVEQAQGPIAAPAPVVPAKPAPDSGFDQLARVDAPQYREPRMRGAEDAADTQFHAAMRRYQQQDYAGAIPGLTEAARLNPKSSSIQFFLGVTHLLNGDRSGGIMHLRTVAAMEDSLEAGDAHFFLGKTLLGEHDAEGAVAEFQKAIAGQSERAPEAKRIIDSIRGVR
jgi:hypothetical protein